MPTTNGDSSAVVTVDHRLVEERKALADAALPARACGPGRAGHREEVAVAEALADRGGLPGDRGGRLELPCGLVPEDERDQQIAVLGRFLRLVGRGAAARARASRSPGRPRLGRRGSCRSRSRHAPRAASRLARGTGGAHARGSRSRRRLGRASTSPSSSSSRSSASRGAASSARANASYASSHARLA